MNALHALGYLLNYCDTVTYYDSAHSDDVLELVFNTWDRFIGTHDFIRDAPLSYTFVRLIDDHVVVRIPVREAFHSMTTGKPWLVNRRRR